MAPTSTLGENDFDLGKEQRAERLKWVFFGVGAMVFVVGKFFLREQVANWVLHASSLTILCYGSILYVHEIRRSREIWLWKSVLVSIPVHAAFIWGLLWWDTRLRNLTQAGYMFVGVLFTAFAVEMLFLLSIFEHFRPSSVSGDAQDKDDSPESKGTWQGAADRLRGKLGAKDRRATITVGSQEVDFQKHEREKRLNWSFYAVASLLLIAYLFRGISLTGAWLDILKISLFTTLCYGHLLYVGEKEHIRESWVWKAILVTIPFHISFLGIMLGIDRAAPYLASNAIVFLFLIWAFAWVETKLMGQIADDFQP